MTAPVSTFLDALADKPELLTFNRGIEREALRVNLAGNLAATPHPAFLGSKLTHPKVTTDFSEAQLELITPVHTSPGAALDELLAIHGYIYQGLEDEVLWSASMPCMLQDNDAIPVAYYGDSNLGRLKTTYRNGLGYRYGRGMQTICAVHYNFSFSNPFWQWLKALEQSDEPCRDFQTRRYFDLMRNFRRYSWLLTYLFGASPAVCNSFIKGKQHSLQPFDEGTAYLPFATSLRSGNLGYQSDAQAKNMSICYNDLAGYVGSLASAICTGYAPYADIGVVKDDEFRQVNANILQSEAEFYSSIRAKRIPGKGENFLACLLNEGVQYIEVRLLDANPYLPLGIDEAETRFLDAFLLFCLTHDSPEHDDLLCDEVDANAQATVYFGRDPELRLHDKGRERSLKEWAGELLTALRPFASLLDALEDNAAYSQALSIQEGRLQYPAATPSGSILNDMKRRQIPFFKFAMEQTLAHRDYFLSIPPDDGLRAEFNRLTKESLARQAAIEAADKLPFDEYLAHIASEYLPLQELQ